MKFMPYIIALRDIRRTGGRRGDGSMIFIACLALGIAAMTAVAGVSNSMLGAIAADGQRLLGGDLALRTIYKPLPAPALGVVNRAAAQTTTVIETRSMALLEGSPRSSMVEIKAVDSAYPLYGQLVLKDAAGNDTVLDGDNMIAVEPAVLTQLSAKLGDSVTIGKHILTLKALISVEPDRVSGAGYSLAPRVIMTAAAFEKTGLGTFGNQITYDLRMKTPPDITPEKLRAQIEQDILDKTGTPAAGRWRDLNNAAPQVERMIKRLTQFLLLIGLATLTVGGVGLANAARSYLDAKMPTIATLKALGMTGGGIFRVYAAQVLILCAVGITAGIALGAAAGGMAGRLVAARFDLPYLPGLGGADILVAAAYGFLMTAAFTLWPLGQALQVRASDLFRAALQPAGGRPPRGVMAAVVAAVIALAALVTGTAFMPKLAAGFMLATLVAFLFFAALSVLLQRFLRQLAARPAWRGTARLAARNLSRPGNSLTQTLLSLGLGLSVLVAVTGIEHSFSNLLREDLSADTPAFFILDIQPDQRAGLEEILVKGGGRADGIKVAPSFRGRITRVNGVPAEEALKDRNEDWVIRSDRGFTVAASLPPSSRITGGAWWPENYSGPQLVSIAGNVARAFGIGVGDKISANILGIEVEGTVANVRDINWSSFSMNFAVTFSPGILSNAPTNMMATAVLPATAEEAVQRDIVKTYPNITVIRVSSAIEAAQGLIRTVAVAVRVAAVVTLAAGMLVLSAGVVADRRRHAYDAIILKVMGATRRRIFATFLAEYALLGTLAAGIAALIGAGASYAAMTLVIDLPWKFSTGGTALILLGGVMLTLLAGFAGTFRLLGQKPAAVLRND